MKRLKIGVWGLGYVGLTTAVAYAKEGVRVTGYDVDYNVRETLLSGKCHIPNLERWMGATVKEVLHPDKFWLVSSPDRLRGCNVHFIAVPTEKDGEPWLDATREVTQEIAEFNFKPKPLVVIESTLVPGTAELLRSDKYHLCIAPRRDFFNKPELNLRNLNRVWAADSKQGAKLAKEVLSIVCDHLIQADTLVEAEMVKSVENSLLHVPAVYAQELALAYPNVNVRKVLQLASTHWRIPWYYPSFGTGGYCIPTSSKYVLQGAEYPIQLTIAHVTILVDVVQPIVIAELMSKCKRVLVMGICYKGDLKVHKGSPALPIIGRLQELGVNVSVTDPYYTPTELLDITKATPYSYETIAPFDGIIIVTDHQRYKDAKPSYLRKNIKKGTKILDNYGVWDKHRKLFDRMGVSYHVVGDAGWANL